MEKALLFWEMIIVEIHSGVKTKAHEPISKLLKSVTPAKVSVQKRAENTG
jgi:hypothetical protein